MVVLIQDLNSFQENLNLEYFTPYKTTTKTQRHFSTSLICYMLTSFPCKCSCIFLRGESCKVMNICGDFIVHFVSNSGYHDEN